MGKLIVSLSPHAHGSDSVERNMYGVLIALIPTVIVTLCYFGLGSLVVLLTSIASCVFFEWAITRYILKETPHLLDGSAMVTGLLLGLNLPSNLPIYIIIIGALVAIGIGKMTFGGLGNNPFNPALVGRCFLRQLPGSDDLMAEDRTTHKLPRCADRCHTTGPDEDCHQVGRPERSRQTA